VTVLYQATELGWAARGRPLIPYVTIPPPDPDPPVDPPVDPPIDPGPSDPPPPAPASWQAAVDTRDIVQITYWYEAHTGFDGINPEDPNDLPLRAEDLTWVEGGLKSTHDGQVFEGLHSNHIRIRHNNVTFRRCRITNGAVYGAYHNPTFDSVHKGTLIEFVTFDAPAMDARTNALLLRTANTTDHVATMRYCDVKEFDAGFRLENRMLVEYSYFHDFAHPEGGHSNSVRMIGDGGIARRNLATDGTSGLLSWYIGPTHGAVSNSKYHENIIGGAIEMPDGRVISPISSASYMFMTGGEWGPDSVGLEIIGNLTYGGWQYGPIAGKGIRWGEVGNYRYDNVWLDSGEPFMVENRPPAQNRSM